MDPPGVERCTDAPEHGRACGRAGVRPGRRESPKSASLRASWRGSSWVGGVR
ncbi:hypothetical protein ATKI12_4662 [Kitasatospora sp. Ki12]